LCSDPLWKCTPGIPPGQLYVCVDDGGDPVGPVEGLFYPANLPERDRCGSRPPPRLLTYNPQPLSDWAMYVERRPNHEAFAIQYPADWQPHDSFECCPRFLGENGLLFLDGGGGPVHSIEDACMHWANHKLLPYGTDPSVE